MTKTQKKIANIEQVFDVKENGRVLELYYDGIKVGELKKGALNKFPADRDGQIELMEYLLEMLAKHLGGTLLEFAECECEECDSVRIGGIRGDVLLSMDSSSLVKRAVLHTIKRKKENA